MQMMKALGGLLLIAASTTAAFAAAPDERTYGFLDAFLVRDQERVPARDLGFGGRLGIGVPVTTNSLGRFAVEAGLFGNPISLKAGDVGEQEGLMLDAVQSFDMARVQPFVFGGLGAVREGLGGLRKTSLGIEAGVGLAMALTDRLNLRTSLSAQDVNDKQFAPFNGRKNYVDYRFNLGVAIPFGGTTTAARSVVDTDGDGVPDAIDKCPTVPANTPDGCPAPVVGAAPEKDSDGDGVPDSRDACPGTLPGTKVDARGCAVQSQAIVLKGVTFLTGSAELTPEAKSVLDKTATGLAGQPDMKVEIGGHTDSMGDAKRNLELSQRRAEAVRKYLVGKGIDGARLTAKGYGSSNAIASNKTKAGRAENRRVELKVVK